MPDYKNAKIYKIWSPEGDDIYIGATTQPLFKRLHEHKNARECSSKILFEKYTDVRVELIECCPCNSKEELNKKEGEFIRTLDCVNKKITGRTKKEWSKEYAENNKEQIKERNKEYYDKNKEQILEKNKEYVERNKEYIKKHKKEHNSQPYTCECGRTINFGVKARHLKSKIHKELMQQVVEPQVVPH